MKNEIIINYFKQRNDAKRLDAYEKYDTLNEETLLNLIHEYNLSVEYNDIEFMNTLIDVIDYLFDCYNG